MELTDLRVFLAVAEEGNVTRAAQRLEYVQSNVTTRIRKLEGELGRTLFDRHPKGVALTPRGAAFRTYVEQILHLVDDAIKAVTDREEPEGPLSIGVVETMASVAFMQILADFQTKYPGVALSLHSGTSPELLARVTEGKLDGAFVSLDVDERKWIVDYRIEDEVSLYRAVNGHSQAVAQATWIMFPKGCPYRQLAERWLQSFGASPERIFEVHTLDTMINAIGTGLGVSLLPRSVIPAGNDRIMREPLPEPFDSMATNLVRKRDKYCSAAFSAFVETIKTHRL